MQAIAFAGRFENVAAVRQPIEHGACQALAAENFGPLLEGKIGRHDQRLPLVGAADHLEEEFRAELAGGDVTQLVEDQQIPAAITKLVGLLEIDDGHPLEAEAVDIALDAGDGFFLGQDQDGPCVELPCDLEGREGFASPDLADEVGPAVGEEEVPEAIGGDLLVGAERNHEVCAAVGHGRLQLSEFHRLLPLRSIRALVRNVAGTDSTSLRQVTIYFLAQRRSSLLIPCHLRQKAFRKGRAYRCSERGLC